MMIYVVIINPCKDLSQTVNNTVISEPLNRDKASETYMLKLLSGDYSNVKLRVEEKVRKSRRIGDLCSIVRN
nr:hypothetical protein [Candidatus Njordarchaeota archaeon]